MSNWYVMVVPLPSSTCILAREFTLASDPLTPKNSGLWHVHAARGRADYIVTADIFVGFFP